MTADDSMANRPSSDGSLSVGRRDDEAAAPSFLDGLNETQAEAVRTIEGPVLVLAGAGTGKTRVLTTRLAHILASGRARPWQVLAVTFTNKAAREMRERVAALLGQSIEGWWVGTFHAIGARMLRGHAERVGLKPGFTILDTDDQLRLLKQLVEARGIDGKKLPPRLFAGVLQRWKDRGLIPEQVTAGEGAEAVDGHALPLYHAYQERLRTLNACDFGDLLLHVLTLFREHPDVAERWRQQFRYLLVDEYQDTNVAQYLWLRALAQGHHNLCCVGDDDQSIYSWRGAEVGNILRFERDFPGARVIRLECNYRSSAPILAAASALIAHNRGRLGKTLWTTRGGDEKVRVLGTWDGEDEARVVCDEIRLLRTQRHSLREMAILVRAGFQTREFEERLILLGIPYRVVGGARFYERLEIRDAIAYFRIIVQGDDDLAFERIVNTPKRGLGAVSLRSVHLLARREELPLLVAAARLIESDDLKPQARSSLARLIADIGRWREMLARLPHPEVARVILDESGYTALWQADRSPEAAGRLENLKELVAALAEFDSLPAFLEHVGLVMDNDEAAGDDKVALMTLHAAKGLEFDTVFLPGWEEGIFPNQRALDEGGDASLEEERRLAYVGLTRARQRAIVTYAASRMVFGTWQNAMPSRFVKELPDTATDHSAPTGLFRATPARSTADGAWPMATPPRLAPADAPAGGGRWPDRRAAPPLIEGRAERVAVRSAPAHPFTAGQRVFHQKFGYGRVRKVDGDRLEIDFEKAGAKTVIHSFVEPAG
jgi:DNA helicase II / ATP-dependent DNA helicase PcrA